MKPETVKKVAEAIRPEMELRGNWPKQYCNLDTDEQYDEADIYAEAAIRAVMESDEVRGVVEAAKDVIGTHGLWTHELEHARNVTRLSEALSQLEASQ